MYLRIIVLDLSCAYGNNDWLYLYDGYNDSSRQLFKRCSKEANAVYKSSSNNVFLKMTTDGKLQGAGFRLNWGNLQWLLLLEILQTPTGANCFFG